MIDRSLFSLPGIRAALAQLAAINAALGALAVAQAWALALAISRLWAGGALASSLVPATVFLACYVLRQATRTLQDSRMERCAATCSNASTMKAPPWCRRRAPEASPRSRSRVSPR